MSHGQEFDAISLIFGNTSNKIASCKSLKNEMADKTSFIKIIDGDISKDLT